MLFFGPALTRSSLRFAMALILFAPSLAFPADGGGPADSPPVGQIEGFQLGAGQLAAEMARRGMAHSPGAPPEDRAGTLAEEILTVEMLTRAARERGLDREPDVRSAINTLLVQKLVTSAVDVPLEKYPPTEDEIQAYYDAHRAEFTRSELRRPMIFTAEWRTEEEKTAARDKAQWVLDQVVKESAPSIVFGKLAKTYSSHPTAAKGGDMKWLDAAKAKEELPERAAAALFALEKRGQTTGIIEDGHAFLLILLADLQPGTTRELAECRGEIRSRIIKKRRSELYAALLKDLKEKYGFKLDLEAAKKVKPPAPAPNPDGAPPKFPIE